MKRVPWARIKGLPSSCAGSGSLHRTSPAVALWDVHSQPRCSSTRSGNKAHDSNNNANNNNVSSEFSSDYNEEKFGGNSTWRTTALGVAGAGGLFVALFIGYEKRNDVLAASASPLQLLSSSTAHMSKKQSVTFDEDPFERRIAGLPTYRKSQVAQHDDPKKSMWVTYRRGVFDVTEFIGQHPGGDKILMAAGGSLEGFWELYPVHKKQHVFDILARLRVGNLHDDDVESMVTKSDEKSQADAFVNDPKRNPLFMARSTKPFNGETPPRLLVNSFHTPNDIFYVRNHLPVPEIDIQSYELEVEVEGCESQMKGKGFTLDEIKKLSKKEISATIQCGGNRRSDMNKWKEVHGLSWSGGAIGNARWAGASLRDVLRGSGILVERYENPEDYYIHFEGLDSDPSGESYGASIPLAYLLDSNFQPIVAYEMNGEPLPLDHGFPLRIILPGIVGARNVKWLSRILISKKENQSPWQQRDYKVFSPSVTLETVDYTASPAIMDTPVTSYICSHEDGQVIGTKTTFQGYAFSGGGRHIIRVEVSTDRGKTWTPVNSLKSQDKKGTRNWSWALWEANIMFPQKGDQEIWVKAVDSGYNQQPENSSTIWNYRGLLSTAIHKIKVLVE